ncbi:MAG: lysozyme inhibitor LprI family protein [Terracidiphilus sp.]
MAILLVVSFSSACVGGQEPCKFGYASEKAASQLDDPLKQAPTCSTAADILSKCAWGSSADVGFASIVLDKCEKTLLPKLTAAGKQRYQRERELCAYEYSGQEGTLYLSAEAMCGVYVALRFEEKPSLAEEPAPRASFDCGRASTSLEKAICADDKLGRADIVLERAYRPVLRSMTAKERPLLIRQQRIWRNQVESKCGVGKNPLTALERECVQEQFEKRFMELDACGAGGPEECLHEEPDNKQ